MQYDGNLTDIIIVALNETGVLNVTSAAEIEQLVYNHKCVFLFDGLNEVAGNHRSKLYAELASFLRAHPSISCIITSRSQDGLWRRFHSREMIEDAVVVRRITDEEIVEYLVAHLGQRRGQELYDRLNQALRGLARIPLLLWLIKDAGLAGEELPGNRGELFDRFVRQVLKREQKHPDLVTIAVRQKMQALSHLAFHLQQEHRLACGCGEAVRVIQQSIDGVDGTALINEALRNGLLMGETRLHFMHQSLQEYFAALRLATLISSTKGILSATSLKRQIRKCAKDDRWAEVIVQLAGLTKQPELVAKQLLLSNPWLAYWCNIEGKPLTTEMQSQIERQTVARLDSPKVEERSRVVNELARMENPRTIGHLTVALADPATPVQELASRTLARLGEPSVSPLLDFLTCADESGRWAATRTLGAIWCFPEMARLGAEQSQDRWLAAEVLGNLGDDRAVLPLIAALQDSYGAVRRSAVQALGRLGDVRAVEPLMRALERSYAQTKSDESSTIAEALATLGKPTDEPLLIGLRDLDSTVRKRALVALAQTWCLPTIAELADDDPETRREAARKLGEMSDERLAEPLLAALKDQNQSVRWEATRALGQLLQFSTLIDLGNANEQIRRAAAYDLVRLPDVRAVEPLIAALQDTDSKIRKHAADALGALGGVTIAPLAALLRCNDRGIRRSVGRALARIDDDRVVDVLALALHDSRSWVRETAAESLARLGDRGVPALETALQSGDPGLCQLARVALRRIGTIRAQTALYFWRWRRSGK
jgi:HEAT repeat protein